MRIAKPIQDLIESFERLPGIGPKTAARLTFYLLHVPQGELDKFGDYLKNLKKQTKICSVCFNVTESDPCYLCQDPGRDESTICVVEQALDILALEKMGKYKGVYHVLGGVIDPLNNIGPDELTINELIKRVGGGAREARGEGRLKELIIATNPTMEGEATAMYITQNLKSQMLNVKTKIKITRIARGLPTGSDIEYADEVTLQRALEGRREY